MATIELKVVTAIDILRGRGGNDYILGEAGIDTIHGNADDDCLSGGTGNDQMHGGLGNDRMNGNEDDDFMYGNAGSDRMNGDDGSDTIHAGAGPDISAGGPGADFVWGGPDNDILHGNQGMDVVMGEDGDDQMHGGSETDAMLGGLGNDLMSGGASFDLMLGEIGNDYMLGGPGADDMRGGPDPDVIYGNDGDDLATGNEGIDVVLGGNGLDDLRGGMGNDYVSGGNDFDIMDGNAGNDHMLGGADRDFMDGSDGDDCMEGNGDDDTLDGGAGNDITHGYGGDDLSYGRTGNDQMTGGDGIDIQSGATGDDTIVSGDGSIELIWGAVGDDTYEGTAGTNIVFDPFAGEVNTLYQAAGINLEVFPSTINGVAGNLPSVIPVCSVVLSHVSSQNINFDAELFERFFEGAFQKSVVSFDGLSGVIAADEYADSHNLRFDNIGGIGAQAEGDPASTENLDGYDGSYRPDGDTVYITHPNHVDPFTLLFDVPVQSVGSFVGTGIQGANFNLTIEAFDADDNLIASHVVDVHLYEDGQNTEGFWAIDAGEDSIAKVTILNNNNVDFGNALIIDEITFTRNVLGDLDGDGELTSDDVDILCTEINAGSTDPTFDLNGDGNVDLDDHDFWVKELKHTWYGDANLDGEFNSSDLVKVFQAGLYETGLPAGWMEGDWNCDGVFDSGDLVKAFADGGFEQGPLPAVATNLAAQVGDLESGKPSPKIAKQDLRIADAQAPMEGQEVPLEPQDSFVNRRDRESVDLVFADDNHNGDLEVALNDLL